MPTINVVTGDMERHGEEKELNNTKEKAVADHIFSLIVEDIRKTSNISAKDANRKTNRGVSIFRYETAQFSPAPWRFPSIAIRALLIPFLWPPVKDIVDRDGTIKRRAGDER